MIDEIAEVEQYLGGNLTHSGSYYRACYMITKYYKQLGLSRPEVFNKVAEWVRRYRLTLPFPLMGCVSAAFSNENELHHGSIVRISQADADCIRMYSRSKPDRRVALALMCCAKAYADRDGTFIASASALASWLGMDVANLRERQLKHLMSFGFVERLPNTEAMHGWKKNYYHNAMRFRLMAPYSKGGKWTLQANDIRGLYEQVFNEPYETVRVNG